MKINHHGKNTIRIIIPTQLSIKYAWIKETSYVFYPYDENFFIVKPVEAAPIEGLDPIAETPETPIIFTIPLKNYICFSFYIPPAFVDKYKLRNFKLIAAHDSGSPRVFLEAFTNGTKER